MRAVLVVNPRATATTFRTRDVLAAALSSDVRVDVRETKSRAHAIELAASAAEAGVDLVVALGGDGTVNEVVNGLLQQGVRPDLPALAVVPGGSTNVFARAIGLPSNPVEATGQLLEALKEGRSRRIGLGLATISGDSDAPESSEGSDGAGDGGTPVGRYFTFAAGLGIDAAVVERVEQKRAKGKRSTHGLYLRCTLNRFYFGTGRRRPPLQLSAPGLMEPRDVFAALICNTDPWTFLGDRPVRPCPEASFETGIDVLAMPRLSTFSALRASGHFLVSDPQPSPNTVLVHDQPEITVRALRGPLPFQVDGDALGARDWITVRSVPSALRVIA